MQPMTRTGLSMRPKTTRSSARRVAGLWRRRAATAPSREASDDMDRPVGVMNRSTRNTTRMQWVCLALLAIAVGCARSPGVAGPDGTVHGAGLAEADLDDAPDYDP